MKVLLTGATGFLGQYLLLALAKNPELETYTIERLTRRLTWVESDYQLYHDFRASLPERILKELQGIDYIIHCGAEVHGLRSLENPELFVQSNVTGTLNLLEAARVLAPKKFVYISSAEVVGSAKYPEKLDTDATLRPSNPYAAAKAAGEMLVRSYSLSYGIPQLTIRTMNIFGERQDTSKFLPATIKKMLANESVVCHVDGIGISGSRQWIYVRKLAQEITELVTSARIGVEHLVGPELSNAEIIRLLAFALRWEGEILYQQPGASHDMRYALNAVELQSPDEVRRDIVFTAKRYEEHPEWLQES